MKPKAKGIAFVHRSGRVERFRDNGDDSFTDESGRRVLNPTAGPSVVQVIVVPNLVDERG